MDVAKYIPQIVDDKYALFLVSLSVCPKCGHEMIASPDRYGGRWTDMFPKYEKATLEAQAKRAGLHIKSRVRVDGEYICTSCEQEGKADFLCELCGQRKPTDKIKESFGDPAEYLCSDCFETVTAEVWEKKAEELHEIHRWDFE